MRIELEIHEDSVDKLVFNSLREMLEDIEADEDDFYGSWEVDISMRPFLKPVLKWIMGFYGGT